MQIREILSLKSADIHRIDAAASVPEAVEKMTTLAVGSLVVMQGGDMAGFLTERDLVQGMRRLGCDLTARRVDELMTAEPVAVDIDDSLDLARDLMTKARVSHIVVFDDGVLAGVMSYHDIARAYLREANFENTLLKRYIKHWPE